MRKDSFTAQGVVGVYKKTGSALGGQQVMCFREWDSLVGDVFERTESHFWKNGKSCERFKNSGFLHTKTFGINLKVSIRSHYFCVMPSYGFALSFLLNPLQLPISTAPNITCSFSF